MHLGLYTTLVKYRYTWTKHCAGIFEQTTTEYSTLLMYIFSIHNYFLLMNANQTNLSHAKRKCSRVDIILIVSMSDR